MLLGYCPYLSFGHTYKLQKILSKFVWKKGESYVSDK